MTTLSILLRLKIRLMFNILITLCAKNEHERFDDSVEKRYTQIIIQYETVKKNVFKQLHRILGKKT